jgi:hypothetical protein
MTMITPQEFEMLLPLACASATKIVRHSRLGLGHPLSSFRLAILQRFKSNCLGAVVERQYWHVELQLKMSVTLK